MVWPSKRERKTSDRWTRLKTGDAKPESVKAVQKPRMGLKRGDKCREWDRVRAILKKEFAAMDIVSCEKCGSTNNLRFAHRYKRRFITTEAELKTVALLCETHDVELEYAGHENLYKGITAIIERRIL